MKILLFTFILNLGFSINNLYNQETIWLDANLNPTTQAKATYYRVKNKLQGKVAFYYKSRTTYRKVNYVNGKLIGRFLEYYKSGKIKEKGKYSNGKKVGIWKTFYKNN